MLPPYPTPIPDGAIDLSFPPLQYENDFATIVGDWGTDSDGWDAIFLAATQILLDGPNFLAGLDDDISKIMSVFGDVSNVWEQDFATSLQNAIVNGTPTFNKFNTDLTGNTPPPPGTAPSGGGANASCATQDLGDLAEGTTKAITINISNNSSATITIKSMVAVGQGDANIFELNPTYTNHALAAGASIPLTITADALSTQPQEYTSILTITTDQPNPQPCMTLLANVTSGTQAPPSGGGGAPPPDDGSSCDVGFDSHGKLSCVD
jgi:hypothetical protein